MFMFVGIGGFFIVNSSSLANWAYNDLSVFTIVLATCGSVSIVGFLNALFLPAQKDANPDEGISPRLRQEGVYADDFQNKSYQTQNADGVTPETSESVNTVIPTNSTATPVDIEKEVDGAQSNVGNDPVSANDISALRTRIRNNKKKF